MTVIFLNSYVHFYNSVISLHIMLTQKRTLKPKTRYLMTTLTSDRSCLYLVIAFMATGFALCDHGHIKILQS